MTATLAEAAGQAESILLNLHKKFLAETGPAALLPFNEAAVQRFEFLKFPHRKHEMYTFANTREMASTAFSLAPETPVSADFVEGHIYRGCESSRLVFVDGVFSEGLSDYSKVKSSLNLVPIEEAAGDIREYLTETIENENDVFSSINGAFMKQGTMIDVPDKARIETPLEILLVSTGSASHKVTCHPRLLVRLGKMAELKLIVKFVGVQGNYFVNAVTDFLVGDRAGVTFTQVQEDARDAWHCSKTRVAQEGNSRFFAAHASSGNKLTRHHFEARLKGAGAELQLNHVSVLTDQEQVHNFVRIHHEAPHCDSRQKFKSVVNDKSRSSVDGTVIVNQGAQQTNSNQLINNLMLSDSSHADSKPNLMIFADDVKCTHGATVGQVDENQIFYLKTRGLSEKVAKELLTKSFAADVIQTVQFPEVVKNLENTLLKKLET